MLRHARRALHGARGLKPPYWRGPVASLVADQEVRVDTFSKEFFDLNTQIESKIESVVKHVASFSDSKETKTRVTRLKKMVMEDLMTSMKAIQQVRSNNLQNLGRLPSYREEGAELRGDVVDKKLKERMEMVMELSASLYEHQDVAKYETYVRGTDRDGDLKIDRKVSDEYTQNRKSASNSNQAKKEILKNMEDVKFKVTQQVNHMKAEQHRAMGTVLATQYEDEIARKSEMLTLIYEKIEEVKSSSGSGAETESIGTLSDAMQLEKDVQSAVEELRAANGALRQKGLELEQAMSLLNHQRDVLAKSEGK